MKQIIALMLLIPISIFSQERVLSLEQSIQLGIENSKELRIAKSKIISSESKISEINSQLFPQLKFQASYSRLSNVPGFELYMPPIIPRPIQVFPVILDNYNMKLSLQQPLFTGFRLLSLKSAAENNYKSSTFDYDKELNEAAFRIQTAFWNYHKAKQIKSLIDENLKLTLKHVEDTRNFLKSGLATKNDLLKLEVQYSNTQLQLIEAENNIDIARSNLNKLLGLALEAETDIASENIDTSLTIYNKEVLIKQANENRWDIKSLEYREKAGEKNIRAARSGWYPSIYLAGNYYYSKPNQRYIPAVNEFKNTWDAGISLQWDLWNWGYTSSQSTQAEELKVQTETSLSQLKDAVELEVYQSYLAYNRALDKIKVSKLSVEQADENYRTTGNKYEQQLATSTDLIDAEVLLLQAKTNLTTSLVDYKLSKVKLEKSIGNKIY
jgi:outer membrane protein TolC